MGLLFGDKKGNISRGTTPKNRVRCICPHCGTVTTVTYMARYDSYKCRGCGGYVELDNGKVISYRAR